MRLTIRNAMFNLGGQLLPMVVAVIAMPLLIRYAGPERLGFLGLAWALIGYFGLLDLGLSRIVTRRVAIADSAFAIEAEVQVLKRLCLQLFLVVAVISAILAFAVPVSTIVGLGADPAVSQEAPAALLILWATLPLTVVTGLLRGALDGIQRFGQANVLRSIFGTWSFAAPVVLLPWSHALGPMTLAIAIGRALSLVAHASLAFRALGSRASQARGTDGTPLASASNLVPPRLLDLMREGGWLTVSNVVGPLMVTFDRFAIVAIVSLAAASYYFVPQEVALRMLVVPAAIATTIFPMLARTDRKSSEHYRIANGALLAIAASCLPLCAVIGGLGEPLLSLWMGPAFASISGPIAACLAVGLFANCCAQVPFAWIQAAGRSDVTGKLHLIQLPLYGALLLGLTMAFGIVGAAIAWSVRATADALLLTVAASRLFVEVEPRSILWPLGSGLALLVVLGVTPALAAPGLRWSATTVVLIVCVALAARLGWRLSRSIHT